MLSSVVLLRKPAGDDHCGSRIKPEECSGVITVQVINAALINRIRADTITSTVARHGYKKTSKNGGWKGTEHEARYQC